MDRAVRVGDRREQPCRNQREPDRSSTRNKIRTAALWGLRARGRFMHDGLSFNVEDAIQRHGNQAAEARDDFNRLSSTDKKKVLAFLNSL